MQTTRTVQTSASNALAPARDREKTNRNKPPQENRISTHYTLWQSKEPGPLRGSNRLSCFNRRGYNNIGNNYEEEGNQD